VIHYNSSAIRFYERLGFEMVRHLQDFYFFDQHYHSAFLFVYYVNNYQSTLLHRIFKGFRSVTISSTSWLSSIASMLNFWAPLSSRLSIIPAASVGGNKVRCEGDVRIVDSESTSAELHSTMLSSEMV
jgi:hypothetical protein